MSRASLRRKQYRPMSADFTKVSDSLSSMFSNENAKPDKGNVLLITYKRGMSEVDGSPPLTPEKPFVRSHSKSTGMTLTEDSILEEEIEETRENSLKNSATHLLRPDRRRKSISSGESWGSEEGRTYREAQTNRQQSGSIRSDEESCGGGEGKVLTSPSSLSNTIWSIDSVSWASKDVKDDLVAPKDTKDDLVVAPKDWDGSFVHAVPSVPLASEDSDLGESADFESFSEDEEEEEKGDVTQTPENKDEFAGLGGFLNTRSLREKFRESRAFIRRSSEREVKVSRDSSPSSESFDSKFSSESRLSRLFSLRRSIGAGGGGSNHQDQTMPRVREEEDAPSPIPSLTPSPALNLSSLASKAKQVKRRCIINTLIESENSYVSSLQRIVHQYKGYLEDSNPPLLSATKLETLFFRVTDILNCHLSFREGLRAAISTWEKDEMIGGVFVSVFSNPDVLAAYSDFIINFNNAMDVVKTESKRKSAFADFLKVKTLQNFDRLNLFGLMVKPIQRFPQFIMIVQDLLKETPRDHRDRMCIQQALTTLECMTGMLNEQKRISEQSAAFKANVRTIGNKLGRTTRERVLVRADEVQLLEFNQLGQVARTKQRKLLLLNDSVVCVSVSGRSSEVEYSSSPSNQERLNLKWSAPYTDIEIVDGPAHGTLARMTAGGSVSGKRSSLGRNSNASTINLYNGVESGQAESLAQEMADLMHDYDIMSRISGMLDGMKTSYPGMTSSTTQPILNQIQAAIRQKDEEISYLDKCCLHLSVRRKDRVDTLTFQMATPRLKDDWVVELRMARLAVEPSNSPSWSLMSDLIKPVTKLPLYVKNMVVHSTNTQAEVTCGLSYTLLVPTPTRTLKPTTYIWVNCSTSNSTSTSSTSSNSNSTSTSSSTSVLRIFSMVKTQQVVMKELGSVEMGTNVNGLVFVPKQTGLTGTSSDDWRRLDMVWVLGADKTIFLFSALDPDKAKELGRIYLVSAPMVVVYYRGAVWVGLHSGDIHVYVRGSSGQWETNSPAVLEVGSAPISSLTIGGGGGGAGILYAAAGNTIAVIDADATEIERTFEVESRWENGRAHEAGHVTHLACAGLGLWVARADSPHLWLYHTETYNLIQSVDLSENIGRVLVAGGRGVEASVSSLAVSTGLLWVGTSLGLALTLPLPRLGGVPTTYTSANISYHAHHGPVRVFLPINQTVVDEDPPLTKKTYRINSTSQDTIEEEPDKTPVHKQSSATSLTKRYTSPRLAGGRVPLVPRKQSEPSRSCKTLPRGFSLAGGEAGDSLYGLYEDLLNVTDYDTDNTELNTSRQNVHKSDPELNTIPYRVSTLDRRMTMKLQRPRSLDLSSWSVESRSSSHTNSSSDGSEKTCSPSVSRNASFLSTKSVDVHRSQSVRKPAKPKTEIAHRTVTTLMGGRGYINWLNLRANQAKLNPQDATIILWDQKV